MPLMRIRSILLVLGFLVALVGGYLIARTAVPEMMAKKQSSPPPVKKRGGTELSEPDAAFRKRERPAFEHDQDAENAGALVGQRSLAFKDKAALDAFLARAGNKIRILGRIDSLNVIRIAFLNFGDVADLLDGSEELGMIFPAFTPENESVGAQPGAVGMGNSLLEWLGITGDNSQAGAGVKIAILDTGVSAHPAFGGKVIAMTGEGDVNGHGTAVASMIAGSTKMIPGVAPQSTILSFQIADPDGYTTNFEMAQAIRAAIEAKVQLINISMGGTSGGSVLEAAVAKAYEAGILIIAPTGNNGVDQVLYPAAYKNVIAVGAVDRNGTTMAFSNTGSSVDAAAPGFELNAAWLGGTSVSVSGTSFSGPVVAGMISKTMSEKGLTAQQAWDLVSANLNDAGAPGYDTATGQGLPDMGRVSYSSTKGIYDAAVSSQWVSTSNGGTQLLVTVQNRGTEMLVNTAVEVNSPAGPRNFNATTLPVGQIQTFTINLPQQRLDGGQPVQFTSTVRISGGQTDSKPANNSRVETYTPAKKK